MNTKEKIDRMVATPGLYLVTSPSRPTEAVPVFVNAKGDCFSMVLDDKLSRERWNEEHEFDIQGPLQPFKEK